METLYICQIPYFEYYDGTEAPNIPACMNFLPVEIMGEDGASLERRFGPGSGGNTLPAPCSAAIADAAGEDGIVRDATVVFCAKADSGAVVTVGWYRHANVTSKPEHLPMTDEEGGDFEHPFFFCTALENAVLLPTDVRFQPMWQIPRVRAAKGAQRAKPGLNAAGFWIVDENADSFRRAFLENITAYEQNGDNLLSPCEETSEDEA